MAISAPFSTEREADDAYYGSSSDGGGGGTSGGGGGGGSGGGGRQEQQQQQSGGSSWGKLQAGETLGNGWTLAYQDQKNGDRRRWFAIRMKGDTLQALNSQGKVEEAGENTKLSELPHFGNEDDARAAYKAWAESNGKKTPEEGEKGEDGKKGGEGAEAWGKWSKVSEQKPWHIYGRSHKSEDKAQFLATSTLRNGSTVYLAPKGKIQPKPHVYDTAKAVNKALKAYFKREKNGEIPEEKMPTGDDPGAEKVRKQASSVKTSSKSKVERLVEKMGGKKVAIGALAIGGVAVYQSQKDNGGS